MIIIILANLLPFKLQANELNLLFKQANNFFQQGNYYDAIKIYQELEKESNDTNLYYNIGNCYSQINEQGFAVLYYKRALRIDSSNWQARKALNEIENTIISATLAESSFTNRLLSAIYNWLSLNRLALIVFLLVLTLGLFIFIFLSQKISISIFAKRFYLTLNIFLLALFILISVSKIYEYASNQQVVIVKNNTRINKDEDGRIYSTNKKLQAGLSLKFVDSLEDRKSGYSLLALPNGELVVIENQAFEHVLVK
jgi:tetratricopeptide (TPR) repeat protein